MDNSIANKAIKKFLEADVSVISMDTIHGLKMQAEISLAYLNRQITGDEV